MYNVLVGMKHTYTEIFSHIHGSERMKKKKKKRCKIVREGNGRDRREGKRETQGRNVTAELWFSSEDTHGAVTLKEPLYSPLMTNIDEMLMQLKTAVLREKYVPLPLWIPPQIPHGLPWD